MHILIYVDIYNINVLNRDNNNNKSSTDWFIYFHNYSFIIIIEIYISTNSLTTLSSPSISDGTFVKAGNENRPGSNNSNDIITSVAPLFPGWISAKRGSGTHTTYMKTKINKIR